MKQKRVELSMLITHDTISGFTDSIYDLATFIFKDPIGLHEMFGRLQNRRLVFWLIKI